MEQLRYNRLLDLLRSYILEFRKIIAWFYLQITTPPPDETMHLPTNYLTLLANVGLLLVSTLEFLCAAISSYKSARVLCPCFQSGNENSKADFSINSHALVSSWLGKHSPPPLYVVTAPPSVGARSKVGRWRRIILFIIIARITVCKCKQCYFKC